MSISTIDMVVAAKASITEITINQANTMLAEGSTALDVRELLEYETGHIPNALHISRGMLEFMIVKHPDFQEKSSSIVLYCKSGGRSALATATLQQMGFNNIYSMAGGFDAWSEGSDIPPETQA